MEGDDQDKALAEPTNSPNPVARGLAPLVEVR